MGWRIYVNGKGLMRVREKIEEKLNAAITLQHLEVINESNNHNVPPGSESHFKVVLVSPDFLGLKLIARHRLVNKALEEELACDIHALALHTYTEDEWRSKNNKAPMSPPCLGGSKAG